MKDLRALLTGSSTGERARVAEMDRLSSRIVLDFSALPLRSEHIVLVGARYERVRCANSKLMVLNTRDRLAKWTTELQSCGSIVA